MEIVLTAVEKGGEYSIAHDLNFQSEMYESKHVLVSYNLSWFTTSSLLLLCRLDLVKTNTYIIQTFKNPKPNFMQALKETGPVPGDEANGVHKQKRGASKQNADGVEGGHETSKKRKRGAQAVCVYISFPLVLSLVLSIYVCTPLVCTATDYTPKRSTWKNSPKVFNNCMKMIC